MTKSIRSFTPIAVSERRSGSRDRGTKGALQKKLAIVLVRCLGLRNIVHETKSAHHAKKMPHFTQSKQCTKIGPRRVAAKLVSGRTYLPSGEQT